MGLLDGKRLLITGVITDASIAYSVARVAIEQGATVVLTGFGRLSLVERVAKKLPGPAPVVELDVTSAERPGRAAGPGPRARRRASTACCTRSGSRRRPRSAAASWTTPWEDVATAVHVSTYSLPVAGEGGAAAAAGARRLDRRAHLRRHASPGRRTTGWAWPRRGWSRPPATPARELGPRGIRVNLVAAGPLRTMAARSIPGLQPVRGRLGRAGAARLGHHRPGAGRPHLRRAAVGLDARGDRRDRARRRRVPRDGRVPRGPAGWTGEHPVRRAAAAVLRRSGGTGRRAAVPGERRRAGGACRGSGCSRWPSTTRTSAGCRRSTTRTGRCWPRSGPSSTCRSTGATATGTRWSRTPSRPCATTACGGRWCS